MFAITTGRTISIVALVVASAAPAAAQSYGPFGIGIVRGVDTASTSITSDAWIDPGGVGSPVMVTRGAIRRVAGNSSRPEPDAGFRLTGVQGVIHLPVTPYHRVWWDWTRDYRRQLSARGLY